MANPACSIPTPQDKRIAALLSKTTGKKVNPFIIKSKRELYNRDKQHNKEPLSKRDNKAIRQLKKYDEWRQKMKELSKEAAFSGTNLEAKYATLTMAYTAQQRQDRINYVAVLFSTAVDALLKRSKQLGEHYSREQIVRGIAEKGLTHYGEGAIFNIIKRNIEKKIEELRKKGETAKSKLAEAKAREEAIKNKADIPEALMDEIANLQSQDADISYKIQELSKMLNNWEALITFSRVILRDREGVKLGNKVDFSVEADEAAFTLNDLETMFDPEETVRESWQESAELRSAFGSIGKEARKLLSTVPIISYIEDNHIIYDTDDLGIRRTYDPSRLHNILLEKLRGMTDSDHMIRLMTDDLRLSPIVSALNSNSRLKTQFFCDLYKTFQKYSVSYESKNGKKRGTKLLNKTENPYKAAFEDRIKRGKKLSEDSIYNEDGTINIANIEKLQALVKEWLGEKKKESITLADALQQQTSKYWQHGGTLQDRMDFISDVLHALGLVVDHEVLRNLMYNDNAGLRDLLNTIQNFATSNLPAIKRLANRNSDTSYYTALSYEIGNSKVKSSSIIERLQEMMTDQRLSSKVVYIDKNGKYVTIDSNVQSGYMSDIFMRIQRFVQEDDRGGLKKWIEDNYLIDSSFGNPNVRDTMNPWIREIYEACESGAPLKLTIAGKFDYEMFLGSYSKHFTNFTEREDLISLIAMFKAPREQSFKGMVDYDTAKYPTFILGDSGKRKYITAKRYSTEEAKRLYDLLYSETGFVTTRQNIDMEATNNGVFWNSEPKKTNSSFETFLAEATRLGLLETETGEDGKAKYKYLGEETTQDNVNEVLENFYWNYKLAMASQLHMFTLSPNFYQGSTDLQKRYKEVHAPGGILDIAAINPRTGELASPTGAETAVYFNDIKINSEKRNAEFMNVIKIVFKNRPDIIEAYRKNTLTDGQGYRSFESYMQILIMQGKDSEEVWALYDYIQTLRANPHPITAEEKQHLAELAVVLQPLKPFTYTQEAYYHNGSQASLIPVQHKYAEVVLIPELLDEGSGLKEIATWMQENNVDLALATSAVKVGSFGSVDISKGNISENLSKAYQHKIKYQDVRIQTNLPEHFGQEGIVPTQARKLWMSGINMQKDYSHYLGVDKDHPIKIGSNTYTKLTGKELNELFCRVVSANIYDKYEVIKKAFSSAEQLSDILIQSTISNSRNPIDDIFAFILNEDKEFANCIAEPGIAHDVESTLLSLVKKTINKQKIYGGSAVQASALGIRGLEAGAELEYKVENDNVIYAQAEIPFIFSYTNFKGRKVKLDYSKYCDSEGYLLNNEGKRVSEGEVSKLETEFPGILDAVCLRLPTEALYSIINIKVVKFSPEATGGIVRLPPEVTTIVGCDFDADKMYFNMKEFVQKHNKETHKLEWDTYDPKKSPEENSRVARNNLYLELSRQRLMDPETCEERLTPGGFKNAIKASEMLKTIMYGDLSSIKGTPTLSDFEAIPFEEPELDPTDPLTLIRYNQQNQVAEKIIGSAANQKSHNNVCKLLKTLKLSKPISFAGKTGQNFLDPKVKEAASHNISELLASSVDAVKNPVLNYLGINLLTVNSASVALRLGFSYQDIGLLFNQPAIRELCDLANNNNLSLREALRRTQQKYERMAKNAGITADLKKLSAINVSVQNLINSLYESRQRKQEPSISYLYTQVKALQTLQQLANASTSMQSFLRATKMTSSNTWGSTYASFKETQLRIEDFIKEQKKNGNSTKQSLIIEIAGGDIISNKEMNDKAAYLDSNKDHPFSYEQTMWDAMRNAIQDVIKKYFPYETKLYSNVIQRANIFHRGWINEQAIQEIYNDLPYYLISTQTKGGIFDGESVIKTHHGNLTRRQYYYNYFADDLITFLNNNPQFKSIPIFQKLGFYKTTSVYEDGSKTESKTEITTQGTRLENHQKEEITESWADLLTMEGGKFSKIAEDLFLYNFYRSGFSFTSKSFIHLAPVALKQAMIVSYDRRDNPVSYMDFMKNIVDGKFDKSLEKDFLQQFILNHAEDPVFTTVVTINDQLMDLIGQDLQMGSTVLSIDTSEREAVAPLVVSSNKKLGTIYKPLIKVGNYYYILCNPIGEYEQDGALLTYKKVDSISGYTTDIAAMDVNNLRGKELPEPTPSVVLSDEDSELLQQYEELFHTDTEVYYQISLDEGFIDDEADPRKIQLKRIMAYLDQDKTPCQTLDEEGNVIDLCN